MHDTKPVVHADLEIRPGTREEGGFPGEITFSGERELAAGYLAPSTVWEEARHA